MASDEEMEAFEITEEDLLRELNPYAKRRKFTKEDAIYGMWAEHDSDEEYRGKGKGKRNDRDNSDYISMLSFVAASADKDGSSDEELAEFGKEEPTETVAFKSEEVQAKKESVKTAPADKTHKSQFRKKNEKSDREFGKWEKYTTGFGSRILAKMGYKPGDGLGQGGGGIVNPVEAVRYTSFGQQKDKFSNKPLVQVEDDSEEEVEAAAVKQWKKSDLATEGKKKPKYTYKTVDELLVISNKQQMKDRKSLKLNSNVKVIDLTGKEKRTFSSYHEIHQQHTKPDEDSSKFQQQQETVYLPELLHNITLLVEKTEHEIVTSDKKLRNAQDQLIHLKHEDDELNKVLDEDETQINKITELINVVEIFENQINSSSGATFKQCEAMVISLKKKYPHEYKLYDLSSLAYAAIAPLVQSMIAQWDMLKDPSDANLKELYTKWRSLLTQDTTLPTTQIPEPENMDLYDRLVWELWMPKFRSIISVWSPRNCIPVVDLLDEWIPLFSDWIVTNVLDQLIMPKLHHEVDNWDPTTDTMPIHAWIHPWLPIMKNKLEPLYVPIRYKLAVALNNWNPSDSSAYMMLKPWAQAFSPGAMETFLARTIIPKLAITLDMLDINPRNQNIEPFRWVMAWRDMIPVHHFVALLEGHFFPKWHQVFARWLTNKPNYDEVVHWYSGWKSLLGPELNSDITIKSHFNRTLDMMNHAVSGTYQPGIKENMAYFTTTEKRSNAIPTHFDPTKARSLLNAATAPASLNFKDIVEKMAADNGLLFMPAPGQRRYNGKAVYTFGKSFIYFDKNVVFVGMGDSWRPISLDQLVPISM